MGKPMTKREALQACVGGWTWQAKQPQSMSKCANPVFNGCRNCCPCCEYSITHERDYCDKSCLIAWPEASCMSDSSPFTKWRKSDSGKGRTKYARQIVGLARKALARLRKRS